MYEPTNAESRSEPQPDIFLRVFGCFILSILLTGAAVLVARMIPLG